MAGKYTDNKAKTHIKPGDNGANKWQVVGILWVIRKYGS